MELKKYISVPTFAAVLLAAVSCGDKGYTPGEESNYLGVNVYFEEVEPYMSLPLDEYYLTFNLERDDAPRQDEYVPIHFSCSDPAAFDVPESVFFAKGQMSAELTVAMTPKMENFKEYGLAIYVDEAYTQQYISQTTYPRVETTVVREDYKLRQTGRYICGGTVLHIIDWGANVVSRTATLEYSVTLDAYRIDPWGHGHYVKFTVTDETDGSGNRILQLDSRSYVTGETYFDSSTGQEVNVTATLAGDATFDSRRRTYTFPFDYGYTGNSAGTYDDTFSY